MSHKVFGVHLTKNKLPGETVPFPLKAMVNWLKENASCALFLNLFFFFY